RPPEAGGENLERALERLLPGERTGTRAPAIGPARPGEARRHVHEADTAAGRAPRLPERVIERSVAQIGPCVARDEGSDAAAAQARHDVLSRQAGAEEVRPARIARRAGRRQARRIDRSRAGILRPRLDLEATGTRGNAEVQGEVG